MKMNWNNGIYYQCKYQSSDWEGVVHDIEVYETYTTFTIQARGSMIDVCTGRCRRYQWIVFPILDKGTSLSHIKDTHWNMEQLEMILGNPIDAMSVTMALKEVAKTLDDDFFKSPM